jgi:type I restriction-modification system DNA methylase subunit
MENMVEGFGNVARKFYYILVQNRDVVIEDERRRKRLTPDELVTLEEALNIPYEDIPFTLSFSVKVSDVEQTFEAKRQNMLALTQLYGQYSNQTFPLAMQLFGPQGQQIKQQAPDLYQHMLSIYIGATKLIKDVFLLFGEEDADEYVPDIQKHEKIQDMLQQVTEMLIRASQGGIGNATGQITGGPGAGAQGPGTVGRGIPGAGGEPGRAENAVPGNQGDL